ncbi:MAG: class I SAM-dependent rRNA methyltransferase [Pseudomonadota bacterium]|nr:class I SAM-dependent rRNA methyltransferase [Pseudomonadota bacterium]
MTLSDMTASPDPQSLAPLWLKKREEKRLRAGHLWIYSNEVDTARSPLSDLTAGQLVQVRASNGQSLGTAYANPHSLICARLLCRDDIRRPNRAFFLDRLQTALSLRERFYSSPYYRLVYGESDGLPGLVVDRYGDYLVVQLTTAGSEHLKEPILEALGQLLEPRGMVLRNDSPLRQMEGLDSYVETIGSVPDEIEVLEGNNRFLITPRTGQKTGWFFDQAATRSRLAPYVRNATVLDMFSYVGAWGIAAKRHGATEVTCVDSSKTAISQLETNANANGLSIETQVGNAFDVLKQHRQERRLFDVVILDPPAFIKRRKDLKAGMEAYRRLNQHALQVIKPGGFLWTGSCSYHMATEELLSLVQAAARHVDRSLQLIEQGGQAPDHPIHPAIRETAYLKMFAFRVLRA